MRSTLYLETSVISYLAALPSRDLLIAAHQQITHDWWHHRREDYIAVAVCHGIDYLLTWNCAHIANAELRPRIDQACRRKGYAPTVLCTPDELMGGQYDA
jgi:hypothetical protein